MIPRQQVNSSLIKSIGYDRLSHALEVEFTTSPGKVYRYEDVKPEEVHELHKADSIGKAFNQLIRPRGGILMPPPEEEKKKQ